METNRKTLAAALMLLAAVALLGLALAAWMAAADLNRTDLGQVNIFYVLYSYYEPANLVLLALLALVLRHVVLHRPEALPEVDALARLGRRLSPRAWTWAIAAAVVAVAWGGAHLVYHRHPFSMDEFTVLFQAEIFAGGRWTAPLPEAWRPFARAATPLFVTYLEDSGSWVSAYLPVYAALLAPFYRLGVPGLLNPLMAAASLLALVGVARNLWPERPGDRLLAVALLASSPQFLVAAMSGYTMPAHLAFNLAWLWLYTSRTRAGHALAPWVGAAAMGLHAFVPHALFATPFLFRLVLRRRWRLAAYYAAVYLTTGIGWIAWVRAVNPIIDAAAAQRFGLPNAASLLNQGAGLALLAAWQPLALTALAILGLRRFGRRPAAGRDLAWSALLTYGFYFVFLADQGHGWGNRYFHPALGNLALLAVPGWHALQELLGRRRALSFVAVSTAVALFVQLPLRALEVERVIRPFAAAERYLASLPEPIVAVDPGSVWYGQDLVRNRPGLVNRPRQVFLSALTPAQYRRLQELGPVRFVGADELVELGLRRTTPPPGF